MNQISEEIVERTWKEMASSSPEDCIDLIADMQKDQPYLLAYLMAVGDDILNQDERELLLYLGVVVWQMMKQGDTPLTTASMDDIDKVEDSNMAFVEKLMGATDEEMKHSAEGLIADYAQPAILKWIMTSLFESSDEPEEYEDIRDENIGIIAIFLKTVVDCLDQ